MKITDYFPPSSPPVLLPEVPLPPSSPAKSAHSAKGLPMPPVADCDQAWLPDGYSRIFRIVCVWPFGLLDNGSATLRCKI